MTDTQTRDGLKNVSLSHATKRPEDLIPAFMACLDAHNHAEAVILKHDYRKLIAKIDPLDPEYIDKVQQEQQFLLDILFDELNFNIAPDGYYFGEHPGDGSDYGFWQVEDM